MRRVFRPLAVFSIASGVSLAVALQLLISGARGHDGPGDFSTSAFFPGYDLEKLDLIDPTLYHLAEGYVDRGRLDWEAMFVSALAAVEREVPACTFSREAGATLLSVEIGEYRTVLEVPPITRRQELHEELRKIATLLAEHLDVEDIPNPDEVEKPFALVEYALINGMLSTLDPHSVLLPPEDAREMDVENQGAFGGLGISVSVDNEGRGLLIEYPMSGKAADRAGLRADDRIIRIDGESTVNMTLDDAVRRLRGPVGAEVVIEVVRPAVARPLEFTVERELISVKEVRGALVDNGDIAYLKIEAFHEKVEQNLHEELARLTREAGGRLGGLILDLRGNPGGFLNQAVKVADAFLEEGDIVSTVDGDGRQTDHDRARPTAQPRYPIVVLVDASSASASEIVAGALRYNERAVVVGERTFGKGSVQNLHTMVDNSKLKLTISRYLTPGNRSIQAVGIPADIALVSSIVPPPPEGTEEALPIRVYHRDRVRREADLDHSLERSDLSPSKPQFRVRYVEVEAERPRFDELQLDTFHVSFARDLLKAAGGWRRADVLRVAHTVVHRYERRMNEQFERAVAKHGIDWSTGPAVEPSELDLDLSLDLGEDERLLAGVRESVALVVTNRSDRPVYRLVGIVDESDVIGGAEFVIGKLAPGETRRYEQPARLPAGWTAEESVLALELRDVSEQPVGHWRTRVRVDQPPLPRLAWRWSVQEVGGDGDELPEPGESLQIELEVENVGEGPTVDPFARLRNRSGAALDLVVATLEPGDLEQGCESAKQEGCRRVLAPGETWSGVFEVQLNEDTHGEPYEVELTVGDAEAYDHGTVVRNEFVGWFSQRERLRIRPDAPVPSASWRRPPEIRVTRGPTARASTERAVLSGVVTDDEGLRHVMVFAGGDKAFYEGGGPDSALESLPFTADVQLEPGPNVLSVLATDRQGFVSSRSVITWMDGPGLASFDP